MSFLKNDVLSIINFELPKFLNDTYFSKVFLFIIGEILKF